MMVRALSRTVLIFFLSALFASALFIVPAYAQAAEWHIQDNVTGGDCTSIGTWDAQTKTCTLTQDLSQGIIIDSDNVTLNGNGRTATGANGNGVFLSGRTGVTINNLTVKNFGVGVFLDSSNGNTLTDNVVSNNGYGIALNYSSTNTLTGNNASSNYTGIQLYGIHDADNTLSSNNTLTNNTANSNTTYGISINYSNDNILTDNTAQENLRQDVYVAASLDGHCNNSITSTTGSGGRPIKYFSSAVTLSNETLSELILCNADGSSINNVTIDGSATEKNNGMFLIWTDSSTIANVDSSSNCAGIYLDSSSHNTLTDNTTNFITFCGPGYGGGIRLESSSNNTLASNIVSSVITLDHSDSNTLTGNATNFLFVLSSNNILRGNTASNGGVGIKLFLSSGNTITYNTVANNTDAFSAYSSTNNKIYNNNFINNFNVNPTDSSGNIFNLASPVGGNYWSNYDTPAEGCNDENGDNFCDTPYTGILTADQDNLPWVVRDGWLSEQQTTTLTVRKVVVNDNGGTKQIADFPLFVDGTPVTSGVQNTFAAGTRVISETNQAGYSATMSGDCTASGTVTLAAGDSKTCIITNDDSVAPPTDNTPPIISGISFRTYNDTTPPPSSVTSYNIEVSWNTDEPADDDIEYGPTIDYGYFNGPHNTITPTTSHNAGFGSDAPLGYIYHFRIKSRDPSGNLAVSGDYTFTIGSNTVAETSPNNPTATLTVIKQVINDDGGTKGVSDFPLFISGGAIVEGSIQVSSGESLQIPAGFYLVTESNTPPLEEGSASQYVGSFSGDCDANGNITLALGDNKTCIITNDDVEEPEQPFEQIQSELNQLSCLRDSGQTKNTVVITHGWRDSAAGWAQKMAADINNALPDDTDWNVCTYDWQVAADTPIFAPSWAYSNAANEGEHLAQILLGGNYDKIHLIAHSAGSNLIQTAAKKVVEANPLLSPKIHLTFLDAYHPHGSLLQYGLDYRNIGTYTFRPDWWAEQYVDMRGAPILNDTNLILENAYNFIVDKLDAPKETEKEELQTVCVSIGCTLSDAVQSAYDAYASLHSFPQEWYDLSTTAPLPKYGFSLSAESGLNNHPLFLIFKGSSCTLVAEILNDSTGCEHRLSQTKYEAVYGDTIDIYDLLANNAVEKSTTGSHEYPTPTSVLERTGSPVWFKIPILTEQGESILQFKYEFVSTIGSEGILTVLFDDDPIYTIDERVAKPGLSTVDNIIIGAVGPGTHSIKFQLDPFTDVQSAVKISDVQIGTLTTEAVVDTLPPTTSTATSGTFWKNGWYIGTTTVTLTAQDNPGGVGVEKTEHSLNGGQIWKLFVTTSPVLIATEGTTAISYRSVDFFGNMEDTKTLELNIMSVKWFLEDALAKLKTVNTGNKDIDKATGAVEKNLAKIIADKQWLDRNRLSWPGGLTTLIDETGVVRALGDILNKAAQKRANVPAATQQFYRDAQNEIVQSAALLANLSFDKAKAIKARNTFGQRSLDAQIARIQKMLDRAAAKETTKPDQAVQLYGSAWFASEMLLKISVALPFRASDFGALYIAADMKDLMN